VAVESALQSFCAARRPAVLESVRSDGGNGRYTILACDPVDQFRMNPDESGCPFKALGRRWSRRVPLVDIDSRVPFAGGWIGYFSYEAGLRTEGIVPKARRDSPVPLAHFHLYDCAAVYDHLLDRWYATAIDWPDGTYPHRAPAEKRIDQIRRRLARAATEDPPAAPRATPLEPVHTNMTRRAYSHKLARIKRHIKNGDVYQVNLTQRFTTRTAAAPVDVYRRLRAVNPSSYAAFLPWGEVAVISSSPELFLDLRGGRVVTRPIKGTRPRVCDPVLDPIRKDELRRSAKDRAELTMIVDLLRNALGRVCDYGSIQVTQAAVIETHPTVFHLVGTIEGDLAPDRDWVDLLVAAMPGGSITGAPKIRAMQIIDDLESTARTVYCGSIGYVGLDGSMSLNIAIRTMVQIGRTIHLYAGGGIVADSEADAEYEESLAKALGMMRALDIEGVGCQPQTRIVHKECGHEATSLSLHS